MPLAILRNKKQETAAAQAAVFAYCVYEKNECKGKKLAFFEDGASKLCKLLLVQKKFGREMEKVLNIKILCKINAEISCMENFNTWV